MARRPKVPNAVQTELLTSCRRRCCLCYGFDRETTRQRGQIAHLDHDPANNSLDNLAYLCLKHHDEYDSTTSQSKRISADEVKRYRDELQDAVKSGRIPLLSRRAVVTLVAAALLIGTTGVVLSRTLSGPHEDVRVTVQLTGTNCELWNKDGSDIFEASIVFNHFLVDPSPCRIRRAHLTPHFNPDASEPTVSPKATLNASMWGKRDEAQFCAWLLKATCLSSGTCRGLYSCEAEYYVGEKRERRSLKKYGTISFSQGICNFSSPQILTKRGFKPKWPSSEYEKAFDCLDSAGKKVLEQADDAWYE